MKTLHLSIIIGLAGMTAIGIASFTLLDVQSKNNESGKYVFEGNYEISQNMTGSVGGKSFFVSPPYPENYVNDSIQFHSVIFSTSDRNNDTNPSGFVSNLVRFSDGINETLTTGYGRHPPNTITILTKHQNPQAGLTRYSNGSINFLVNTHMPVVTGLNETYSTGEKTNITINSYTLASNDTTYLSQTIDEWKNKTPEQLNNYYKKYKDTFYDELGSFLIKDEMKKELERQNIQNIHDDFKVFPGMTLDSLPPHIGYDAVVNATDGNSYLLLGGVFANKIESLKITKLVFDKDALHSLSTGERPFHVNPFTNTNVGNSTVQEAQKIAGIYVENSDIPWSSVGTGNYGVVEISLYTSVYHMIPDAQKYYTVRAMQLIPFYIQIKILPPPVTEKQS